MSLSDGGYVLDHDDLPIFIRLRGAFGALSPSQSAHVAIGQDIRPLSAQFVHFDFGAVE